jgi:hypothetical protein
MISVGKRDPGPGIREYLCDAQTNAASRARDDRDLAGQPEQVVEATCQR